MSNRLLAMAVVLLYWPSLIALPAPPSEPLPDWPCSQVDASPLTVEAVLPHPLPIPVRQDADRQADPQVGAVADFAGAPENTPNMGTARIVAFARQVRPAQRPRELLLVLEGIVVRTNQLRRFIRDGIEDQVAQSRLFAGVVADNDREIAALSADAPAEWRRALERARHLNVAALGDRGEEVALLCHRLDYTARKARRLAGAIADQIEAEQTEAPK